MVGSRWLPGGTGYLALRGKMTADPDAIGQVHAAMRGFAPARALVIDIRDNPGGSRDLLRAVIGYLLAPGAAVVTSWARLRRAPGTDPEDVAQLLEGRFMRPWNWPGWSPPARAAAESFAARHAPEWPAPDDARFGPLNLMIAERLPEHGTLHLDCPVALLTNIRNYSAADIFAAALAVLPQVTLLGTPTAGGSGFARRTVLPGSRLAIQISTMASGMISGDLFENRGVLPDEIVAPTLAQWREPLECDPLILRALRRLAERPDRNDTQQTRHRECIG
jgi:C-terminal processing protease CtpA/Prc